MKRINDNRGFTLVELIVVIGIIGVLVGIAVPTFFSVTSKTAVTRATRDVTVELKAARQLAISRNMQYRIVFTLDADETVARQYRINTASPWQDDITKALITMDGRVDIQNTDSPGDDFIVTFNPNGSAVSQAICMENSAGTSSGMQINVYSVTGRVESSGSC